MNAEKLCRLIEAAGLKPRNYSGHGMYGAECVAVSGDESELVEALSAVGKVPKPSIDSLGRGVVFYWPRFKWEDTRGEDESEAEYAARMKEGAR